MNAADPGSLKLSHEHVALRAFSKWLARGCPDGDGETDWYDATQELEREYQQRQTEQSRQESVARWPVPTLERPAAWWAVYGKLHERDGIRERLF